MKNYFTPKSQQDSQPIVYGLALGGGGTKGSYEIGVLDYLVEKKIPIGAVAGTSIGSVNGAMFAMGRLDKAKDAWMSLDIDVLLRSVEQKEQKEQKDSEEASHKPKGWRPDFLKILDRDMSTMTRQYLENGGIDMEPLKDFLARLIDEEALRNSDINYTLSATDVTNFEPKYFNIRDMPSGQLIDYILASCSVPVFKLPEIDGIKYLDGGFHDNIPVGPLHELGYKHVIAVDLSGIGINRSLKTKGVKLIHIKNSADLGATFQFDQAQVKKNIRLGYLDAKKAFGGLSGHVYYLKNEASKNPLLGPLTENERAWLDDLLVLPQSKMIKNDLVRNMLLKQVKKYKQDLGLNTKLENVNFISAALEITAEQLSVKRLQEYTLDQLLDKTLSAYEQLEKTNREQESQNKDWLWQTLKKKNVPKLLANNYLPDIVEKYSKEDKKKLFPLLSMPLPRYTITALFLLLMKKRKAL
ncbi:patatin-like phospholipase family protein [Clostridia bacterium]|nr:patatin-like phospholipase family protein [Clostridia bacterium]